MNSNKLTRHDLSSEKTRRYIVCDAGHQIIHEHVFKEPRSVYIGRGHSFHRVETKSGDVTLCPVPGPIIRDNVMIGYCRVVITPVDKNNPVQF
jgi:hypothetical protein